jgi:hypothetical protein
VSTGALALRRAFSKCAALFGGGPTIRDDDGGYGGAATFASFFVKHPPRVFEMRAGRRERQNP